jgi:hypothetical protein
MSELVSEFPKFMPNTGAYTMTYVEIPYASEQGIFAAEQGIKSGDQGIFQPDQGILILGRPAAICR